MFLSHLVSTNPCSIPPCMSCHLPAEGSSLGAIAWQTGNHPVVLLACAAAKRNCFFLFDLLDSKHPQFFFRLISLSGGPPTTPGTSDFRDSLRSIGRLHPMDFSSFRMHWSSFPEFRANSQPAFRPLGVRQNLSQPDTFFSGDSAFTHFMVQVPPPQVLPPT